MTDDILELTDDDFTSSLATHDGHSTHGQFNAAEDLAVLQRFACVSQSRLTSAKRHSSASVSARNARIAVLFLLVDLVACTPLREDASTSGDDAGFDGGERSNGDAALDDAAVVTLGASCMPNGALGCSGFDSALSLVCERGVWARNITCPASQRCDSSASRATQGQCLDIVPNCLNQAPNHVYCDDNAIATCGVDRVTTSTENCRDGYTCALERGEPLCRDRDECAVENGDCDPLSTCVNIDGGRECGPCPAGYFGSGSTQCAPTLSGLAVSTGVLEPILDQEETTYVVRVPLSTETITLMPEAPTEATVTVDGLTLERGDSWTSPTLESASTNIAIEISQPGQPSRTYTIEIARAPIQEAFVKAGISLPRGFGEAVALSGDTLVIGAPHDSSTATGVFNGVPEPSDISSFQSGAAYVFVRSGSRWIQQAYFKPSNDRPHQGFGHNVAVSGDTIVVGASFEGGSGTGVNSPSEGDDGAQNSGAAYVFVRTGTTWTQQAYVKASNTEAGDQFGCSVAISGNTLVVGALTESGSPGANGQLDNALLNSGAAYVFVRSGTTWVQQAYLKASNAGAVDSFGKAVAVWGSTIAVTAHRERGAGTGVNNSSPGEADNSANESGAAYVFVREGTVWRQQAYIKASNTDAMDHFGESVALFDDTLAVGTSRESSDQVGISDGSGSGQSDNSAAFSGAVYVFARTGDVWSQQAYLKGSDSRVNGRFGLSVAVSEDFIVVGALTDAVHVFGRATEGWMQRAYVRPSSLEVNNAFGVGVAVTTDYIVVTAPAETCAATGINGMSPGQDDNGLEACGAAYVFH